MSHNILRIYKICLWEGYAICLMIKNLSKISNYLANLWMNIFSKKKIVCHAKKIQYSVTICIDSNWNRWNMTICTMTLGIIELNAKINIIIITSVAGCSIKIFLALRLKESLEQMSLVPKWGHHCQRHDTQNNDIQNNNKVWGFA